MFLFHILEISSHIFFSRHWYKRVGETSTGALAAIWTLLSVNGGLISVELGWFSDNKVPFVAMVIALLR